MTKIPDEFVEELRKSVDIVDVISEYVQLRRAGRSFMGLCPFHNEKSPSFSVSPDRQLYHCFGCGAGGTVLRFLMEIDGLTFTEAVVKLAEKAGLALPVAIGSVPDEHRQNQRWQRMLEAHQLAAKYYNYILMNSASGVQALTYLEGRGISRQTMVEFQLGAAPDIEDSLVRFLVKRHFELSLIVEAGLGIALGSKVVDRFRSRVMIPICDQQGNVISFGGRALAPDAKPKYLNSPETPLFHKSEVLFNLHFAKRDIRKTRTVVLSEGYMDVISGWQAGVKNIVATMGTAITEDHARVLKRYADTVVVAYDSDAAGIKAAKKAIEIAGHHHMNVRVATFPDGLDPDDFVRTRGAAAFVRQVQHHALTELEFLLADLRRTAQLDTAAGRTDFLRKALTLLGDKGTPIEQDAELRRLAMEFQISMDALKEELRLVSKQHHKRKSFERPTPAGAYNQVVPLPPKDVTASNTVLQALLTNEDAYDWLLERDVIDLALPEQTALLAHLYQFRSEHPDGSPVAFVDSLEEPLLARLASSLLISDPPEFHPEVIDDCLRIIRLHRVEQDLQHSLQELVQAQIDGSDEVEDLKRRVEDLQAELSELRHS